MLCYCPYSGTNWRTDNFRGQWNGVITQPHPIFLAPLDSLLARAGEFCSDQMSLQEQRLMFLALLHNTGNVKFECPAEPYPNVILNNREALLRFITWYDNSWRSKLRLPHLAVTRSTRRLENMSSWLEAWEACREQYMTSKLARTNLERFWEEEELQKTREAALFKLIHSATKTSENYAGRLAAWAMVAADVQPELREYWTQLFKLKTPEIFQANAHHLEIMVDHMEDNLSVHTAPVYATAVLQHVRKLLRYCAAGYGAWIDGTMEGSKAAWSFADDEIQSVEQYNQDTAIANYAPEIEPREEHYPTRVAFIRARMGWLLKKQRDEEQAAKLVAAAATLEKLTEMDQLEEVESPEDDLDNLGIDLDSSSHMKDL